MTGGRKVLLGKVGPISASPLINNLWGKANFSAGCGQIGWTSSPLSRRGWEGICPRGTEWEKRRAKADRENLMKGEAE
jgi:hypothetical protein